MGIAGAFLCLAYTVLRMAAEAISRVTDCKNGIQSGLQMELDSLRHSAYLEELRLYYSRRGHVALTS